MKNLNSENNRSASVNPKEILELIECGESSTLEFKRKVSSVHKIAKEITALANTMGGYLLIGVDDDGTIYGIDSEKSETDLVLTACEFHIFPHVMPEIEVVSIKGKDILVIYIHESNSKPHKVFEEDVKESALRAYIRVGEKSVIASREMTRILAGTSLDAKPLTLSIGNNEKRLFAYLEKHEKATVKDFAGLTNISLRRAERLLVRLVRAGVLQIHVDSSSDYFTLVEKINY